MPGAARVYKLFLTIRYLIKPLSLVTILALGPSVAILVFAPAIMNGFQAEFHARVRGSQSDMTLYSGQPLDIDRKKHTETVLAHIEGVEAVAPYIEHPCIDRHLQKVDYCFMRAIDPRLEEKVSEFRSYILSERELYLATNEYDDDTPEMKARTKRLSLEAPGTVKESKAELQEAEDALARSAPDSPQHPLLVGVRDDAKKRLDRSEAHIDQIYRALEDGVEDPDHPGQRLPAVLPGVFYLQAWRLDEGSVVKLTTAAVEGGDVKQDHRFVVVGAFRSGTSLVDRRNLYVGLNAAQDFIGAKNPRTGCPTITGYSLKLKNYEDVALVRRNLGAALEELTDRKDTDGFPFLPLHLRARTWEEQNENLLKAVGMEKLLIRLITGAIVLAASASIFFVLFMSVQNKVRELGILRAVGGTQWGSLQIFLGQGLLLSTAGLTFGFGLGLLIARYLNEIATEIHRYTGWHPFPPDVYYLEKIPAKVIWPEIIQDGLVTLLFGFIAALIPAVIAAFRPPIKAIRHE
jgi:ABC-type lipoprotein release transport system permease subunit